MEAQDLVVLLSRYGRDVGMDERAVFKAFEDPIHGTAFKEWVQLHLGDENLLSVDELELYTSLDKAGVVDRLVASKDLATVHPLSQQDIATAIEELERSTFAINERSEALKQHQNALAKLVETSDRARKARARMDEACHDRQTHERKRLLTAVEELAQNLAFKATDLESQASTSIESLRQAVDSVLRSDDKLLSSLKKLGNELDPEDPEEKANIKKLRETCMRLIKFTVEVARTKLDRVYLEALVSAQRNPPTRQASTDEVKGLQEEVESLYSELLPVAQMSVEQQYLEPALKAVSERNSDTIGRSAEAAVYVNACLDYLVDQIMRLTTHAETIRSRHATTADLVEAARTELAVPATPPMQTQALQQQLMSPVRPRSTTYSASAMATPAPGHRRQRSSGAFAEEDPLETLMRLAGVPAAKGLEGKDLVAALVRSQADKAIKSRDVALNAQDSFERAAAAYLGDSRRAIQLLWDSVLAESPFGPEVKLADPEIEASIVVLGQEVAKVRERISEAEDVVAKGRARKHGGGGSDRQREMVERWAR